MDNDLGILEQRLLTQLESLKRAVARLEEAYSLPITQIGKDATVKRFEFTFELSWKLMQAMCEYRGKQCFGPKHCIRTAAEREFLENPQAWFRYLEARNLTTHVYKKLEADKVYKLAKRFPEAVNHLIEDVERILMPKG